MPRVGLETMTPTFEQAKTVHTLDSAATVIGTWNVHVYKEHLFASLN
jgi:hypothetical protein